MILVGPVYIAHPYSGDTERNVLEALQLANAASRAGFSTISPLQESRGRESLGEEYYIANGIAQLSVCRAALFPEYLEPSSGCRRERAYAESHEIWAFTATLVDGVWRLPYSMLAWRDRELRRIEALAVTDRAATEHHAVIRVAEFQKWPL
jgi:hypothetical protein